MKAALLLASFCLAEGVALAAHLELSGNAGFADYANGKMGYLGYGLENRPANLVHMNEDFRQTFSFRFGWHARRRFGHEIGVAYMGAYSVVLLEDPAGGAPVVYKPRTSVWSPFYTAVIHFADSESRFRPFVAIGGHLARYQPRDYIVSPGVPRRDQKVGVTYGGGLKLRIHDYVFFRGDYREYANPKPFGEAFVSAAGGWLRQREISAGIGLMF